ncbi:MAG: hypothetical protein V3U98_03955 [Acidobacteriota bacterium]
MVSIASLIEVRRYELDPPDLAGGGFISALHANSDGALYLGLTGAKEVLWRYDIGKRRALPLGMSWLCPGAHMVHRSLTEDPQGNLYVGTSRLRWALPKAIAPHAGHTGRRSFMFAMRWVDRLGSIAAVSELFILHRAGRDIVPLFRGLPGLITAMAWHEPTRSLLILTGGVRLWAYRPGEGAPVQIAFLGPHFHHAIGIDASGRVWGLARGRVLASIEPHLPVKGGGQLRALRRATGTLPHPQPDRGLAASGIDAWALAPDGSMFGGLREDGSIFTLDPGSGASARLGKPAPEPRLSGMCAAPDGAIYLAAGLGRVTLHRIPPGGRMEPLGPLVDSDGTSCHHVHDLVAVGPGHLFAGEFYPLDTPRPAPPARPGCLWEIKILV